MLRILFSFLLIFSTSAISLSAKDLRTALFKVEQLECKNCEQKVKQNIRFEKGIKSFTTDINTRTVTITYDAEKTSVERLVAGFAKFGYTAQFVKENPVEKKKKDKKKK